MKQLIQDKKGGFVGFLIGFLILIVGILFGLTIYNEFKISNNDCLNEIAKEFCEEKVFILGQVDFISKDFSFSCYSNERSVDKIKYKFLDEEIEECVNENQKFLARLYGKL